MGRSRPVFRGKWGISGPQSNYAHPEVQDARNQRSMTRKRTKGSRIKGMGVFEGEGHSLGNDPEQSTKGLRTTSKASRTARAKAATKRKDHHRIFGSPDSTEEEEDAGEGDDSDSSAASFNSDNLDAETPKERAARKQKEKKRKRLLGGGDAAGASSASAGKSKGTVVQGGSGLGDAQRRKLAQAAAARAGKSNGKVGGSSQQQRRGQRADSSEVEVVEGSYQGQEDVGYDLDDDDLEMKGYLPPHLFKKYLETKYGPATPRHLSTSPAASSSGAAIKSNTKKKGANSNRARARALFNLTPDPESSAESEEDLPGPSTIGRRLQGSKSARQASQTPTLDVDRSADGDETITSTEDEGASKARKSKAKKTSKGKAANKGQSGTSRRSSSTTATKSSSRSAPHRRRHFSPTPNPIDFSDVFKMYPVIDAEKERQRKRQREMSNPPSDAFSSDQSEVEVDSEFERRLAVEQERMGKVVGAAKKRKGDAIWNREHGYSNPRRN